MAKFQIQVTTPTGVALEEEADFVKLPGISGEIGVLSEHTPTLALLRPGNIRIQNEKNIQRFFVPHGCAHIRQDKIEVLVPYIEETNVIDRKRAEDSLRRALDRLKSIDPAVNKDRARRAMLRAEERIHLLEEKVTTK